MGKGAKLSMVIVTVFNIIVNGLLSGLLVLAALFLRDLVAKTQWGGPH